MLGNFISPLFLSVIMVIHLKAFFICRKQTLNVSPFSAPCSRSVEMNGYTTALRDQYIGSAMTTHYQFLPHLFSYAAQPRSLYPQSHTLISQLVAAEELAPLATPMLIEDG